MNRREARHARLRRPQTFDISDENGPRVDATAPLPLLDPTPATVSADQAKASPRPDKTTAHDAPGEVPSLELVQRRRRSLLAVAAAIAALGALSVGGLSLIRRGEPEAVPPASPAPTSPPVRSENDHLAPRVSRLEGSLRRVERNLARLERSPPDRTSAPNAHAPRRPRRSRPEPRRRAGNRPVQPRPPGPSPPCRRLPPSPARPPVAAPAPRIDPPPTLAPSPRLTPHRPPAGSSSSVRSSKPSSTVRTPLVRPTSLRLLRLRAHAPRVVVLGCLVVLAALGAHGALAGPPPVRPAPTVDPALVSHAEEDALAEAFARAYASWDAERPRSTSAPSRRSRPSASRAPASASPRPAAAASH